jgi:hypothetical protein
MPLGRVRCIIVTNDVSMRNPGNRLGPIFWRDRRALFATPKGPDGEREDDE